MTFDEAFARLIGIEGDYSDRDLKDDPGGKTRYGITEAVARRAGYRGDMRELPLSLAKRIYLEEYWKPVRADELPSAVRYAAFDAAVNSGPVQSILWLQRAVNVAADGKLGPITLAAVAKSDPDQLLRKMLGARLHMMTGLPNWHANSRGWAARIAEILEG